MTPTPSPSIEPTLRTTINGVSMLNQKGVLKSRYSWEEKLQMLGCNEEHLEAFAELFAPRNTHFSIRRGTEVDSGRWFEGRGEVTLGLVIWHLLGARVPGRHPLWLAPRAWDWTNFVAIDVDLRNDAEDFQKRCRQIEEAFRLLAIPPEAQLVVPTPSGGRHYYFFTSERIRTAEIPPVMAALGIVARKARFEIFPSTSQGLRLPFGHLPGRPHKPEEWIRFIEAYENGDLPMVNWKICKQLAKKHEAINRVKPQPHVVKEHVDKVVPVPEKRLHQQNHIVTGGPPKMGLPKHARQKLQRWALSHGILVMTQNKRQTRDKSGCARTFLLKISGFLLKTPSSRCGWAT